MLASHVALDRHDLLEQAKLFCLQEYQHRLRYFFSLAR
jgi:hypothetical protein